jgi:hypothetical protein
MATNILPRLLVKQHVKSSPINRFNGSLIYLFVFQGKTYLPIRLLPVL